MTSCVDMGRSIATGEWDRDASISSISMVPKSEGDFEGADLVGADGEANAIVFEGYFLVSLFHEVALG